MPEFVSTFEAIVLLILIPPFFGFFADFAASGLQNRSQNRLGWRLTATLAAAFMLGLLLHYTLPLLLNHPQPWWTIGWTGYLIGSSAGVLFLQSEL